MKTRPRRPSRPPLPVVSVCLGVLLAFLAPVAGLAREAAPDGIQVSAATDSLSTTAADTLVAAPADSVAGEQPSLPQGLGPGLSAAAMAAAQSASSHSVSVKQEDSQPFVVRFENAPKAGIKSDVRVNKYYGQLDTNLEMEASSKFSSTLKYSWDDFRQQEKTIEARGAQALYTAGNMLPVKFSANGSWDWTEDKTVNNAGLANRSKRDLKMGTLKVGKPKFDFGPLKAIVNAGAGINDQKAINKKQVNNFDEAFLDGGVQLGTSLAPGLTVAGRAYGKSVDGDRTLGDSTAPSSARGDSAGVGVYFDQSFATGRLAITRSNFDKRYLDYKHNSTGQIDTVGLDEFDKVVDELETKDALTLKFENEMRLGRFGLQTDLSRETNEHAYSASGVGSKKRQTDKADFALTFGTRRDSFALSYQYGWKWDDQRIKNASENRGRQYIKNRLLEFYYGRELFQATDLVFKTRHGLDQDIAQHEFNSNDKDRLRSEVALEIDRDWPGRFKTKLLFSFKRNEEVSIRSTRSSNNNIKESYEVSPGYNWTISDWLTLSQKYRVYIQYTDYIYSDLESVNRNDNYNKRGNLNTIVVIQASRRLELAVRHDYNKRSNATRVLTDATGTIYYHTDQRQTINKIDFGAVFKVAPDVTLEAATFRTRDFKRTFGSSVRESEVFSGEIWIGAKVDHTWGTDNPLQLSALVKKFNAFGPSVTEASSDYWEADVWLKWEF